MIDRIGFLVNELFGVGAFDVAIGRAIVTVLSAGHGSFAIAGNVEITGNDDVDALARGDTVLTAVEAGIKHVRCLDGTYRFRRTPSVGPTNYPTDGAFAKGVFIEGGADSTIFTSDGSAAMAGRPILEIVGLRCVFMNIAIECNVTGANMAGTGILNARNANEDSCGEHVFLNVRVHGHFGEDAVTNVGPEGNSYFTPNFHNYVQDGSGHAAIGFYGAIPAGITPRETNITNGGAGGQTCFMYNPLLFRIPASGDLVADDCLVNIDSTSAIQDELRCYGGNYGMIGSGGQASPKALGAVRIASSGVTYYQGLSFTGGRWEILGAKAVIYSTIGELRGLVLDHNVFDCGERMVVTASNGTLAYPYIVGNTFFNKRTTNWGYGSDGVTPDLASTSGPERSAIDVYRVYNGHIRLNQNRVSGFTILASRSDDEEDGIHMCRDYVRQRDATADFGTGFGNEIYVLPGMVARVTGCGGQRVITGDLEYGPAASKPTGVRIGFRYFNTDGGASEEWNGSAWV